MMDPTEAAVTKAMLVEEQPCRRWLLDGGDRELECMMAQLSSMGAAARNMAGQLRRSAFGRALNQPLYLSRSSAQEPGTTTYLQSTVRFLPRRLSNMLPLI